MNNIKVGDIVHGRVTAVEEYGFWLDISGFKGLVKIVDITWEPGVVHVGDYVKKGEIVKVKVQSITNDTVIASLRDVYPENNPWLKVVNEGDVLKVTVYMVTEYGYLLKTPSFLSGLLKIENASKKYNVGDQLDARVQSLDLEKQRISFIEA